MISMKLGIYVAAIGLMIFFFLSIEVPQTLRAEPATAPGAASISETNAQCIAYERALLALVSEITDSVLFNLRLAMAEAGHAPEQVQQVLSLAKHPQLASYVEQRYGRAVFSRYEDMLERAGCLRR